ncbi:Multidrug resistance protein MdtA precursor [Novipirellula galeiformis]|uniref:Multidrug resistance protein MdtA n=1 Tax=Novipirellula galeiformis TaxID=2528004 RepID=A0A5C6CIE9_9BACT|nr:efflux RND transporter periplasmic adaptor subunit [Novipirellula galeiformis]TWU24218.1 Multidrug resistance protein MdtA precursor [Novipirellula galeiformis]
MKRSTKSTLAVKSLATKPLAQLVFSATILWGIGVGPVSLNPIASAQTSAFSQQHLLVYDGFTEPEHDIMVAAAEVGLLIAMDVNIGERVEAGQTIGRLDNEIQASAVKLAELQARMKANEQAAAVEADLQRKRLTMVRELAEKKMARPDELRRTEADLEIADAKLLAAQEQTHLRRLELERYQLQLDRRQIVSPVRGVIAELFREPGEYVSPSDPVIARLLVIDRLIAVFNVPAEEITRMQVGTPARIFLRSIGKTIETKIVSIAPNIDGESGTVRVRVELDNADHELRPGDRCTLSISGSSVGAPGRAGDSVSAVKQFAPFSVQEGLTR